MISLSTATATALARIDPGHDPARGAEGRNIAAVAISALVPIYTRDPRSGTLRRITEEEFSAGKFTAGASAFVFDDGRPDIRSLVVSQADLDGAIDTIAASYLALHSTGQPDAPKPPGRQR